VRISQGGDRWVHRASLCEIVGEWMAERDLAEVGEAFEKARCAVGPYQTFKQLVAEDPRASTANPMFAEVEHPGLGSFLTAGSPLPFQRSGAGATRPAPRWASTPKRCCESSACRQIRQCNGQLSRPCRPGSTFCSRPPSACCPRNDLLAFAEELEAMPGPQ